jgi:hypothetical protein
MDKKIPVATLCTILCLFFMSAGAQPAQNDRDFFLAKLVTNYPGYKEKINATRFALFIKKLEDEHLQDTFKLLSRIARYFNDIHLSVIDPFYVKHLDSSQCVAAYDDNRAYFKDHNRNKNRYEGYWINDYRNCVMAIRQVSSKPLVLRGYVVESRRKILPKGSINCEFEQERTGGFFTAFADPLWGGRFCLHSYFLNDSILITGGYSKWKKIRQYDRPLLDSMRPFSLKATGKRIDDDNFLVTIPENNSINTKLVDSIVKANDTVIRSSKNLIIDIRNNVGGSVRTYASLFPYIYTGPIIKASTYIYRNPETIEQEKASLERRRKNGDSVRTKKLEKELKDLLETKDGFILSRGDTLRFDSVLPRPKNVALLINYGCMSAAELMILDFKQSKKVRTFGQRTTGAVDYLDFYPVETPSKRYTIYIPGSKRVIPHGGKPYDGRGIEPDTFITEDTVDWIDFVNKFYE